MKAEIKNDMDLFEQGVLAHRGASLYAPENTMAAFIKAHELGIKWVEFDVMLSADDIPIIFHDDTLERTTNGTGFVDELDCESLRKLDAGAWFNSKNTFSGQQIPLLEEVMSFLVNHQMYANIELKVLHHNTDDLVKATLDVVKNLMDINSRNLIFSSSSIDALQFIHHYASSCRLGYIMDEWQDSWLAICRQTNCQSIHINADVLTPERVNEIKSSDILLLSYTVNDFEKAKMLRLWGVDAVFSDNPDITRK